MTPWTLLADGRCLTAAVIADGSTQLQKLVEDLLQHAALRPMPLGAARPLRLDTLLDDVIESQRLPITVRTTEVKFSAVKLKCLKTAPAGADSPYRSTPSTAPLARTYFHQKSVTPASIAMRGNSAGSTAAL